MPLPILNVRQEPGPDDLVRLFHRVQGMWVGHLSEGVLLEAGVAHASAELPGIGDANHVRDAALPDGVAAARAIAEVEGHFAQLETQCAYWVLNPSAGERLTQPLADELVAQGYQSQRVGIYYLRRAAGGIAGKLEGLKVIPARAAYRQSRLLAEERARELYRLVEQEVDASLRHLDDPHFDALLALKGDRPVATLGVLAVGELALIEEVYVSASARARGVGRMMMGRGLEICARSLFKHVFAAAAPSNLAAKRLYEGAGFERIGEVVNYRRKPETASAKSTA